MKCYLLSIGKSFSFFSHIAYTLTLWYNHFYKFELTEVAI